MTLGPLPAEGFIGHVGPVLRLADSRFRLVLAPHHLNISSRFHGGMAMALLSTAVNEVAGELARGVNAAASAFLLALNCEFVGSAELGAVVEAEVSVTRAARSVLFLSCRLVTGNQTLLTGSATYRIDLPDADAATAPVAPAMTPSQAPDLGDPRQGWRLRTALEPFGRHTGPVYERELPGGNRLVGFSADDQRLDHRDPDRLHDGMMLVVADMFTGWTVYRAVERTLCVTLAMQARRMDVARRGEWIEFQTGPAVVTPSVVFVDGSFHAGGRLLMTVSSVWKVMGPLPPIPG